MDRAELRDHLNHLDALVPALRASSHDRSDFMHTFAGMTRAIEAKAINAQDAEFVERRVNEILVWHGLQSTDERS